MGSEEEVRPVLPFGVFSLVGWAVWDISDGVSGKGELHFPQHTTKTNTLKKGIPELLAQQKKMHEESRGKAPVPSRHFCGSVGTLSRSAAGRLLPLSQCLSARALLK